MKWNCYLLGAGLVSLLVGCSSVPVALAPVGPSPVGSERLDATGELQVFSSLVERTDNQNEASRDPLWYQHTDYSIYDQHGKLVKRVDNTVGHYEQAPRRVALPAGQYLVKAEANGYFQAQVPVTIERGRTTEVHLDEHWKLPPGAPANELVSLPDGHPVGWRAGPPKTGPGP